MAFIIVPAVTLVNADSTSVAITARGKPDKPGKPSNGGGGSGGGSGGTGTGDGIVHKYAVVAGVSDYIDDRIGDLSFCDEDAHDWTNYLHGMGYTVTTFIDHQATEINVENAVRNMVAIADADDQIAFVTSGHGTTSSGTQLLLYADCYSPNTDGDGFYGGIVPDFELAEWFAPAVAKTFIFVDHCNSGGLNEAVHSGMYMTTTCGAHGYGYDVPDYQNGAWTYTYLHVALEQQGYTTAEEAFNYASSIYPYGGKDAPCQFDMLDGFFVF